MRVGIIQSSFIPWRGYFDFIASVDLFVFHDDLQYTKGDWRNRNRIKTPKGTEWLTVPVSYRKTSQLICETLIDDSTEWRRDHVNKWHAHYASARYLVDALRILEEMGNTGDRTISALNVKLTKSICHYLNIVTPMIFSSEVSIRGTKTERLVNLLRAVGGTIYLSGPSAEGYLDKSLFKGAGIRLEYKSYDYEPYFQLWGAFEGAVSVLDLIANCGRQSREFVRSRTPDRVIVP